MTLRFGSCFTGIGGFEQAWRGLGIEATVMVEIDKHCRTVLGEHWPGMTLLEDICDTRASDLGRIDGLCGGFPCQDTSIAAPNRLGLRGRRSGHYFEFTRLLAEYQRLIDATNPRWVVIENPTGLLKSNDGRDMAAVVMGLEELGYGWAYRVVDGRQCGTSQRRERVLIVGHRGGDPRPAWAVLGDPGAGGDAHPPYRVGRAARGPRVAGSPTADGSLIWRKSARARKAIAKGGYETWVSDGYANTLTGFDAGAATRQTHLVLQRGRLRTLTLTEWERLQGFPDGWTASIPTSARYQALGNAMHVGMAAWLGRRLVAVNDALPLLEVSA